MISAKNLSKNFGTLKAVRGISFEVKKGEVLGFLGPNGAGKTTTMKLLTGFLVPTAGSVSICGFDISKNLLNAQQKIGYLPEGSPLYGEMTPRTFLNFISQVRGLTNDTAENAFKKVVKDVGLEGVLDQEVETLSKGYQRRLGLAQALIHDPEVLILDEPTDGLDPNQKHDVRKLIRSLARKKAIIISTHILEEVESV
ncbi:MAG: ABC transporter ATP-binding protein, partial [Alphaproteobacteria bacterium]